MDIPLLARCIGILAAGSVADDTEDLIDQADLIAQYIETGRAPLFHNASAKAMVDRCVEEAKAKRDGKTA